MSRQENIVRYMADDMDAMIARGEDKTDWTRVMAKTETELAADTASDPASNGITDEWVKDAKVVTGLLKRAPENKRQVTMRFDADVLDYFRSQGRGWQGRMNAVLRSFIDHH